MSLYNWYKSGFKSAKKYKEFYGKRNFEGRWPSETYGKYPATFTFNGDKVLNLGCGKSVYLAKNVTNLDVVEGPGINVVCTTNKLPFEDNSFDFVLANHVIEHIPNWFETFKELARITKVGGTIEIWIPPISSDSAFSYRDHLNRIGYHSFAGCLSMPFPGTNALAEHDFNLVGNVKNLELIKVAKRPIVKWWITLAWPSLLDWMAIHLRNIISEEQFVFKKNSHDN